MLKKFFLSLFLLTLLLPAQAMAIGSLRTANDNLNPTAGAAGYAKTDIGTITGQVINAALSLVGIIFLALMVYAGYLWMTAKGDESQVEKAQKIVTSAIIGLVLTLSAYAITRLVTAKFGNAGQGGDGQNAGAIDCRACLDACDGKPNEDACINACDQGICLQEDR